MVVTTVDELLNMPFSNRSIEDKIRIVREGKPRPLMNKSSVTFRETDGVMETQQFSHKMYDQIRWLTACDKRECFFCWPCLLFMPPVLWNKTGIFDLVTLTENLSKHEKSSEHAQAELHLQMFNQQHLGVTIPKPKNDGKQYNDLILRNRQMLKRLSDAICCVAATVIPTHTRSDCARIKTEDCVRALKVIKSYDNQDATYVDDAIELIKACPHIVDDLVNVITGLVQLKIKKDIQFSTYISLILNEHTSVATKPQISTFIRYVKDSKVHERFIGFFNVTERVCPFKIVMHISKIIKEYGIENKLLAQSLDGAYLEASTLFEVTEMLKTNYPLSFFVPCYFHGLQNVLKQNLSELKDCGFFFKNVSAMEVYFQSTRLAKEFEIFMFGKIPNFKNKRWCDQSEFLKILSTCRSFFTQFFNSVVQNSKRWSGEEIAKAYGFLEFLNIFKNVFLLQVLSKLLEYTETLEAKLKSHSPESAFNIPLIISVISDLTRERDEGFEKFWYGTLKDLENGKEPPNKKIKTENDIEMHYRELFSNIINRIIYEIKCRFASLDSLEFCHLLSNNNGLLTITNSGSFSVSTDCIQKLVDTQKTFFDEVQLQNEFAVLHSYRNEFSGKTVYDLLEYLSETGIKLVLKNIYRLVELVLTLPLKPPALEEKGSKIEKVRKLSYIPKNGAPSGDVSVLCVESDVIEELRKNVLFYDEIISGFSKINKTIELVHRSQ